MKKGSMKMSSEGRDLNEEKEQENKYLRSECCCFFFFNEYITSVSELWNEID